MVGGPNFMLPVAEKKSLEELRSKRKPLWERFQDHPTEVYLALELKVIDDQIAEYNQQIRHCDN